MSYYLCPISILISFYSKCSILVLNIPNHFLQIGMYLNIVELKIIIYKDALRWSSVSRSSSTLFIEQDTHGACNAFQ